MAMQEALFGNDDEVDQAIRLLAESRFWTPDPVRDRELLYDLRDTYPHLDLVEQVRRWTEWMEENETEILKKKVVPRARLRNWCRWAKRPRASRRPGATGPSVGRGGPAKAAEFGPGGQLEDW